MSTFTTIAKPAHGSKEWLRLRWRDEEGRCTFGASDAPALMGLSPYTSRAELYLTKRNEPQASAETSAFRRGNLLEPVLVGEASRLLSLPIVTPNLMYRDGRFTVTLDGVDDETEPNVVVEAKTTTRYTVRDADDLPYDWRYQGWAQMAVTGAQVFFVVLDQHQDIRLVELKRNESAIESLLRESERFGSAVDEGRIPEDDNELLSAKIIASLYEARNESVEIPADEMFWLQQFQEAKDMIAEGEVLKTQAEDQIATLLKHASEGTFNGQKVVTWKETEGRTSLDTKRLKAEQPDLYEQYLTKGKPFRTMRISKIAPRI
jgi:predicted phage-related endonuclease